MALLKLVSVCLALVAAASKDQCDQAACKDQCECAASKCDVPTCLKDADCAKTFQCAVPKCPCGAGNLPCVKKCVSDSPSDVTKQTLSCFQNKCPSSPFPLAAKDQCDAAKCKGQCECAASKCDVPTCLKDADCAKTFQCAVPKCPCGAGNLPCVKKCVSDSPSDVTKQTLSCFQSKCPSSPFPLAPNNETESGKDQCDAAKCKGQCECAASKCDVPTCLNDADCAKTFQCAVPKCPCGAGNLPCVKKCVSASPSDVTKQTLSCFQSKCPSTELPVEDVFIV